MAKAETASAAEGNHHDRELMQDPYSYYERMRAECPVARSEQLGGFWFTTNYAATRKVYDDFRTFSSADGTGLPRQPVELYPIDLDPPKQTRLRKLLNPLFLPEEVAHHVARMDEVIHGLIDGFVERGEVELQEELVRPMLSQVFFPLLGVPMSDQPMLAPKLDFLTRMRAEDPDQCAIYGVELDNYLHDFVARRRTSPPQRDIIQVCLDAEINGAKLTDDEIVGIATLVLFGGLDTTSGVLGLTLWYLIDHPEVGERLLSGELDFPKALHEFVRYASPIQGLRRTVTRDTVLEGCPLKAGDMIMAMNGAGNHDPAQFPDPDTVRFDRPIEVEHDHLGFGGGAHLCIGQHFAKTLMERLIRAVLTRLPDLAIQEGFEPTYAVGESRVLKILPVRFTPQAARVAEAAE